MAAPPPKVPLILAPTPLHRLERLSEQTGCDLWIKRDDLTGFALGGNKGRKLEYLMAAAIAEGAQAVVTCGSLQSNFVRQLGAACRRFGLSCHAAVMGLPYDVGLPKGIPLRLEGGNELLDRILGVDLRLFPDATWDDLFEHAENLAQELEARGLRVHRIPVGGSSALGAYGFVQAAREVATDFDWIVFASSSGSTQTGLAYAFHGTSTKILGIACDPEPTLVEDFAELAQGLDVVAGEGKRLGPRDFRLDLSFVGPGYGVPSDAGNEAIRRVARAEGIFLDPIYSGKAMAGLLALLEQGQISGRVLFWHTGGTPALFAMPEAAHQAPTPEPPPHGASGL